MSAQGFKHLLESQWLTALSLPIIWTFQTQILSPLLAIWRWGTWLIDTSDPPYLVLLVDKAPSGLSLLLWCPAWCLAHNRYLETIAVIEFCYLLLSLTQCWIRGSCQLRTWWLLKSINANWMNRWLLLTMQSRVPILSALMPWDLGQLPFLIYSLRRLE